MALVIYPPLQTLYMLTPESTERSKLSWSTTEETLRKVFEEYGKVLDAAVMRDRDTRRSRGFGFVTFDSKDEASNAVQSLDGAE
jgi:RNA recognition motif-containing protein